MLDRELNWLLEQGADGVVMAMVSEVLRLSTDEREMLAGRVGRTIAGRGVVVRGTVEVEHSGEGRLRIDDGAVLGG